MAGSLPVWPISLPQNPFGNDDPIYTPVDNVLATQMQGAVKRRPLFTAVPETLAVKLMLNAAQRDTLRAFLKDTLGYVLPFTWLDFRSGQPATYVYADKALPPEQYLGADETGRWWQVQFNLELQP